MSWQRLRQTRRKEFARTKVTRGIRSWPQFKEDWKRVNAKVTVLPYSKSGDFNFFRCARTRVGIHRIADRATNFEPLDLILSL